MSERPGITLPHVRGSSTSRAAADRQLASGTTPTKRAQVLAAIDASGTLGMTDKEVQAALGMRGSTQRPRRVELVERKQVQDSGQVRGRSVAWVATRWAEEPGTQLELCAKTTDKETT